MCSAAVIALISGFAAPAAYAWDKASDASDAQATEVVVTGTRIKRPNLKSASPITSVDDKEVKLQGALQVENVLNRLPQFLADNNENVSNGSDGTAQVNLRGLGSNRNLVLIDGQRFLPTQAVDMNFVPSFMVERTDVLTGGASTAYGSDAISGVVNFVMKKNLDGIRIDAQVGEAQHNNDDSSLRDLVSSAGFTNAPEHYSGGAKENLGIAAGKNFGDGRGNVTAYAGYFHADAVTQSKYDYSACALGLADEASYYCGGSSNSAYGKFKVLSGDKAGSVYADNPDGSKSFVNWGSAYLFNYGPYNYIQRSDNRATAGMFAHYDFSDKFKLDGSLMYMKDHTYSQIAPSAVWYGSVYSLNCDNPLMSAAQQTALCGSAAGNSKESVDTYIGYRMANSGLPRRDDLWHEDMRMTLGASGQLTNAISYDVGIMQSAMFYHETFLNDVNQVKAANALDVVNVNGTATCAINNDSITTNDDKACVPMDIWSTAGPSKEAIAYVSDISQTRNTARMTVLNADMNVDMTTWGVKSPWANDGLVAAIGLDRRVETLDFKANAIAIQNGSADSDGYTESKEAFAELNLPVVQDKPFIKYLTFDTAYRTTKYDAHSSLYKSPEKTLETYKFETQYAPDSSVMFRASFNVAARAPNISELFSQQGLTLFSGTDPCGVDTLTATQAQCALTGLSAANYGKADSCPADQCNYQYGGNPALAPEKARTITVGVVYTPKYVNGLQVSLDYYRIKVDNYIGSVDPQLSISECTAGLSFYCGLIHRDPQTGVLFGTNGYVISTAINTGFLQTSGYDLNANYTLHTKAGRIDLDLGGTYLIQQVTEPLPGLGTYDCKGLYGSTCGEPQPVWKHNLRATWVPNFLPSATVSLAWRYRGFVKYSGNDSNTFLANGAANTIDAKIPAYNYFDLAGTWRFKGRYNLRAGINNIFDKAPPALAGDVLSGYSNGNTYPGIYDPLGRTMFIGLTADF